MNISQALKEKKRLIEEINKIYNLIFKYNSINVNSPRHYSIEELMVTSEDKTFELIELKTKIHKANIPVYNYIFELSELKNRIKQLSLMPTDEGEYNERYSQIKEVKTVEINEVEKNEKINSIQKRINELQDFLDGFNSRTEI